MDFELKKEASNLHKMLAKGKLLKAFDQYYADNVIMQENDEKPTVGKEANRKREEKILAMLERFNGLELNAVAYGDDVIITEWTLDIVLKEIGRVIRNQVSVQHWKNGKVISERFYYDSEKKK